MSVVLPRAVPSAQGRGGAGPAWMRAILPCDSVAIIGMRIVKSHLRPAERLFYGLAQGLICAMCLWIARLSHRAGQLAAGADVRDPFAGAFRAGSVLFLLLAGVTAVLAVLFSAGYAIGVSSRERRVITLLVALLTVLTGVALLV